MKKRTVWLCALGALCLLTVVRPGAAAAQDMAAAMSGMSAGGGTSETSTVNATSVTGGRGGGSSEESRTVSHARSTVTSTTGYNAVDLTVDGAPTTELVVGGVALELSLVAEDGAALPFTPALTHWPEAAQAASDEPTAQEETATALLLTAEDGAAGNWVFSGATLRKLQNSGVGWLVLKAGENALAVPTGGFLGGYTYDRWRSAGVAAKDIRYALAARSLPPSLQVTADGESYPASADASATLYYAGIASQGSGVNNIE